MKFPHRFYFIHMYLISGLKIQKSVKYFFFKIKIPSLKTVTYDHIWRWSLSLVLFYVTEEEEHCGTHPLQLSGDPHAGVHPFSPLSVLGLVVLQEVAPGELCTHEPQKRRLVRVCGVRVGLGDKTITICIAIDTWAISIKNVFDKTFDIFYSSSEENSGCEASLVALTKALALW